MTLFYREIESGNIEYKLSLDKMSKAKLDRYSTQMKYRVIEGKGEAIYLIGVSDSGRIVGLSDTQIFYTKRIINTMCKNVDCEIKLIMKCNYVDLKFLIFKVRSKFSIENLPLVI